MEIQLPISKSIANRLLICKAKRGDDIGDVVSSADFQHYPEDVRILASVLAAYVESPSADHHFDVDNCGTAMRFLTAFFASIPGADVVLDGCARMRRRPIGQLVDALRSLGAEIEYLGEEGYPPLKMAGRSLSSDTIVLSHPQSTQFISALLLIGASVETDSESPYIAMTRSVMQQFSEGKLTELSQIERDWSSAAFWLERRALGLVDDLCMQGLNPQSLQGDRIAKELFDEIAKGTLTRWDFSNCPDLYPAAVVTCHLLGQQIEMSGLESLRLKESDRVDAMADNLKRISEGRFPLKSYGDHRIAMALMAAGYPVDDERCVRKSYPDFVLQLRDVERIVPRRGINDDNMGKKWALKKLIGASIAKYIWMADDDVRFPDSCPGVHQLANADMLILPLRMEPPVGAECSFWVRLQILEYAAIQGLTMWTAEHGHAVMCSGANLVVRRDSWIKCSPALHMELPSGDDMFMLEEMKRRGLRVQAIDNPDFEAVCYAQTSLRSLLRQRMRWAGKAPHYRDKDILLCGGATLLSNMLVVACPLWGLAKWVVDTILILSRPSFKADALFAHHPYLHLWLETLLLTFVYPWYMLLCLLGGMFRRKW